MPMVRGLRGRHARSMSIVQVNGLHKSYGDNVVVHDVSFAVEEGEIFGILGPSGAGKTTAGQRATAANDRGGGVGALQRLLPGSARLAGPGQPASLLRQLCTCAAFPEKVASQTLLRHLYGWSAGKPGRPARHSTVTAAMRLEVSCPCFHHPHPLVPLPERARRDAPPNADARGRSTWWALGFELPFFSCPARRSRRWTMMG